MTFYARWVFTNTWAVLIALALHSAVGELLGIEAASILTGTLIIGGTIGWAQSGALARQFPALDRRHWVILTSVGAALVLIAGAVTTRMGLTIHFSTVEGEEALETLRRTWSAVFLTQFTGFLIGLLIGGPQSRALPAPRGQRLAWVVANGAGWSLGMLLTGLALSVTSPDSELRWTFAALFAGLALTGCSVGLFTGLVLRLVNTHPRT